VDHPPPGRGDGVLDKDIGIVPEEVPWMVELGRGEDNGRSPEVDPECLCSSTDDDVGEGGLAGRVLHPIERRRAWG
jgi:hypothetical protein